MSTFKSPRRIPARTALETTPPVLFASRLALREGNRKKPIYEIHKWWARRLGSVFRNILIYAVTPAGKHPRTLQAAFYRRHDLAGLVVLDPFVGGGTTLVEAAKCNANVIGVDIDPVACFVTRKELEPVDEAALDAGFRSVQRRTKRKILKWYRTRLRDGREGTLVHAFWVEMVTCPSCRTASAAHPHFQLSRDRERHRQVAFCAACGEVSVLPLRLTRFTCGRCRETTQVERGPVRNGQFTCVRCGEARRLSALVSPDRPLPKQLFALEVLIHGTSERVFKKADEHDVALYARAERALRQLGRNRFLPPEGIPVKHRNDPRPVCFGYRRYRDLFNARQKLCLAILASAIAKVKDLKAREFLAAAFSDALAANNMLCFYAFDYRKLTPLFGLHAFHHVSRPVENNVWGTEAGRGSFLKCYRKLLRAKRYAARPFEYRYDSLGGHHRIYTGEAIRLMLRRRPPPGPAKDRSYGVLLNQSAERLSRIGSGTVDLILTDPPYYNNIAYSELSDFFHVWLRRLGLPSYPRRARHTPITESLYVRREERHASRDHRRFTRGLVQVFRECYRVLKPSGLFVFTFHHRHPLAWSALGSALFRSGFTVTNVFPVRSEGESQFHSDVGNLKWDVVFCCRKPARFGTRVRGRCSPAGITARVRRSLQKWQRLLGRGGFALSAPEQRSLAYGSLVQHVCNAGIDPTRYLDGSGGRQTRNQVAGIAIERLVGDGRRNRNGQAQGRG